jgi:hypothetical protein
MQHVAQNPARPELAEGEVKVFVPASFRPRFLGTNTLPPAQSQDHAGPQGAPLLLEAGQSHRPLADSLARRGYQEQGHIENKSRLGNRSSQVK